MNMNIHSYMYIVNNIVIDVHGCVHGCVHVHVSLSYVYSLAKMCFCACFSAHCVYVGAFV